MNKNQVNTVSTQGPYAVFFGEDGEDIAILLSELPKEEEQKGGYLLVTPGVGSSWIPRAEKMGHVVYTGCLTPKFPSYELSQHQCPVQQAHFMIFPKK